MVCGVCCVVSGVLSVERCVGFIEFYDLRAEIFVHCVRVVFVLCSYCVRVERCCCVVVL